MTAGWPAWTPGRKGHDRTTRCRLLACQADEMTMDQLSVRKTFTYQLLPTPAQEQALATVVWRCRAAARSPTPVWKNAQLRGSSAASR
jgi:hypothetical protein